MNEQYNFYNQCCNFLENITKEPKISESVKSVHEETYEDHIKYLINFISCLQFTNLGMTGYVFKCLIDEISLYNQNDENTFIRRLKNGRINNDSYDPLFYMTFDNLFWDSLPSLGTFPIQFYKDEKMYKSKLNGKTIDVILEKYSI